MGTRIQTKSRGVKKWMALGDWTNDLGDGFMTWNKIVARKPRTDKRGYPETGGHAIPVLIEGLVIDGTVLDDDPDPDPDFDIDIYPDVYTVVQGDTLWAISQGWGVTVQEAADWNNIADPNLILIGQVLYKPGVPIP